MFKKTSDHGLVLERGTRPPDALLADFDIDGATLKSDHTQWLDDKVVGPARAKRGTPGGWEIDLIGRASQSGSDGHNLWLSDQRARAVQTYLLHNLFDVPVRFFVSQLGESSPFDPGEYEHEVDRSVEVRAKFLPIKPPKRRRIEPLIVKPHIWKPRPNRKVMDFRLQVLKAKIVIGTFDVNLGPLSFGQGEASVKLLIRIRELGSSDSALYEFSGHGPGAILGAKISLKKGLPVGVSKWSATYEAGEVHPFATDVEMDAEDFGGSAMFRFDLVGRTLIFGPSSGFFGGQEKIKDLSFGLTADVNLLKMAEATTPGKMTVVESVPAWAR